MKISAIQLLALLALHLLLWGTIASAAPASPQLEAGRAAILKMAGCYLVDYSYTETEGLQPGYQRDSRVYDVNKDKSVKEWIYAEEITPSRIRLQHVLFAAGLDGQVIEGAMLKHTGEDWEFEAPFRYNFVSPQRWEVEDQRSLKDVWTRRVTNLDDGLRFQCAAPWNLQTSNPEWACGTFAPIPGRETRDMGRKDYNTMDRWNRVIVYSGSWLEREENTKVIQNASGRTPLAKELGKNWYVRLPDSDCESARSFAEPRKEFWRVIRESWDQVFTGDAPFVEKAIQGQPGRYPKIMALEEKYTKLNLQNPAIRAQAKKEIIALIEAYRGR